MNPHEQDESCPRCGEQSTVRSKLLLIDAAWYLAENEDPRNREYADLRANEIKADELKDAPLEQFVDGNYCDKCKVGFVGNRILDLTQSWVAGRVK